ncbi:unnamed protein product [Calicophoron daubneyi]|uniref:Anoctamin n=1 Tax=Calicophoron daubneyi TaxID=300641 RepID=A0AAV2TQJ3_CALDB
MDFLSHVDTFHNQGNWRSIYTSKNPDLYFRDGKRRIDYVLVYSRNDHKSSNRIKRKGFFEALADESIEIEVEDCAGRILGVTRTIDFDEAIEPTSAVKLGASQAKEPSADQPMADQPDNGSASESPKHDRDSAPPSSMDRYKLQAKGEMDFLSSDDLVFVKLYAPWALMCRFAEQFNFRKPLAQEWSCTASRQLAGNEPERTENLCCSCLHLDKEVVKPLESAYTWPFDKHREYLFDIPEDRDEFFTQVERALVVDYILRRTHCTPQLLEEEEDGLINNTDPQAAVELAPRDRYRCMNIGITKLISDGVFLAAYPLHELSESVQRFYDRYHVSLDEHTSEGEDEALVHNESQWPRRTKTTTFNNRTLLKRYWAAYRYCCKEQPLDYVRNYFGEAVAFYFAWLGFYTACLVPVAIIGLIIFLFGLYGIHDDPIITDVCDHGSSTNMCPLCRESFCKFWTLNISCLRTKLTRLVDNEGTVLFGVVMAMWAIIFLELWKRRQYTLAFRWNVHNLEPVDQPARPEFLELLDKGYPAVINPVSGNMEPFVSFWRRRVPFTVISYSTVLFGVILTLAFLIGVIMYKLVIKIILYKNPSQIVQSSAGMLATATGSVINLILIFLLKFVYDRIAVKMTELEKHRNQIDYDNSLTLKLYLLQFVNHYSSIFYIAYIQGNTAALPGSQHIAVQSTGCDQGDCLFELFLQLIIIMVGKQLLGFLQETLMPVILTLLGKINHLRRAKKQAKDTDTLANNAEPENWVSDNLEEGQPSKCRLLACRADYSLLDPGSRPLFNEYLEMMIQYGFITMFVPAFPLAPFFGLLNNLFEIRGDAKKFCNQYRRPVTDRVKGIGIWFSILVVLSSIAIRTNACVIAFTTQFIDRWVYRDSYSPDGTYAGFMNFTLSWMNSSRFLSNSSSEYCRYSDYRSPPWVDPQLSFTAIYYHVLAAKFIFVFLFETLAVIVTSLLAALIPDVPEKILLRIYREAYITNQIITNAEIQHLKGRKSALRGVQPSVWKDILSRTRGMDKDGAMPVIGFYEEVPQYPPPKNEHET